MPYKLNELHRDKIPKAKYRVTNWSEYDRGLVQRGDVMFWIDEGVIADWIAPWRKGPGGQRRYSNTAILATLTLGSAYRRPLRQAEGFVRSLFSLMGVEIPVPDHTTLARRRRAWRKLHVSVSPASSEIVAHELTDSDTSDAAMAGPLVSGSGGNIKRIIAPFRRCAPQTPAGQGTELMMARRFQTRPELHALQTHHRKSLCRHQPIRSRRPEPHMVAPNAKYTAPRLLSTGEWPGRRNTTTD